MMMDGMDFFQTVGTNNQFAENNTTIDREENTIEPKSRTEETIIDDGKTSLDAYKSDMKSATYRAPEDLAQLVNAEDIKGVKDILAQLKDAEIRIQKSDSADSVKELSQKRIRMVRNKCNVKINRLKLEQALEQQAEQARKVKDDVKSTELENELKRTRNNRKSEEYTDVQNAMQEEQLEQKLDKYSVYEQNASGSPYTRNMYRDMSTTGSFINMSVGNFKSTI